LNKHLLWVVVVIIDDDSYEIRLMMRT